MQRFSVFALALPIACAFFACSPPPDDAEEMTSTEDLRHGRHPWDSGADAASADSSSAPDAAEGGADSSVVTWGPTYYVSSIDGDDTWSGLFDAPNATQTDGPFKSLARARAAMQASSSVKTVTIRAGTYSLAASITLSWLDSGERWMGYPGETATLDGAGTGYFAASGASNITIEGLVFANLATGGTDCGAPGLCLNSAGHTIRWNTFRNCTGSCISGTFTDSLIDSNTIDGVTAGPWNAAISLWYGASNNRISHNLVQNVEGFGIAIGIGPGDPPVNANIMDRNILRNVCSKITDCGALYFYDPTHQIVGNQITNNIVDGNGGTNAMTNWTKAIYLDDLVSNVIVSGNVCKNCGEYGLQIHGGDHNTIANNVFDLSGSPRLGIVQISPSGDFGMGGNTFQHNLVYVANVPPSPLWELQTTTGDALPTDSTNLYFSGTGAGFPNEGPIVDANPIYANPGFANPGAGDYSMPPTSPAYTQAGFQPLATDQGPLPFAP